MSGYFTDDITDHSSGVLSPLHIRPVLAKPRLSLVNSVLSYFVNTPTNARSMSIVSIDLPLNSIISSDRTRNNSITSLTMADYKRTSAIVSDDEPMEFDDVKIKDTKEIKTERERDLRDSRERDSRDSRERDLRDSRERDLRDSRLSDSRDSKLSDSRDSRLSDSRKYNGTIDLNERHSDIQKGLQEFRPQKYIKQYLHDARHLAVDRIRYLADNERQFNDKKSEKLDQVEKHPTNYTKTYSKDSNSKQLCGNSDRLDGPERLENSKLYDSKLYDKTSDPKEDKLSDSFDKSKLPYDTYNSNLFGNSHLFDTKLELDSLNGFDYDKPQLYTNEKDTFDYKTQKNDYQKNYRKNDYEKNYQKNDYEKNDYEKNDYEKNDYQKNDYQKNDYDYNKNITERTDFRSVPEKIDNTDMTIHSSDVLKDAYRNIQSDHPRSGFRSDMDLHGFNPSLRFSDKRPDLIRIPSRRGLYAMSISEGSSGASTPLRTSYTESTHKKYMDFDMDSPMSPRSDIMQRVSDDKVDDKKVLKLHTHNTSLLGLEETLKQFGEDSKQFNGEDSKQFNGDDSKQFGEDSKQFVGDNSKQFGGDNSKQFEHPPQECQSKHDDIPKNISRNTLEADSIQKRRFLQPKKKSNGTVKTLGGPFELDDSTKNDGNLHLSGLSKKDQSIPGIPSSPGIHPLLGNTKKNGISLPSAKRMDPSISKPHLKKIYLKELQFELMNNNTSPVLGPTESQWKHDDFAVPHYRKTITGQNRLLTQLNQKWNKSLVKDKGGDRKKRSREDDDIDDISL